MHRIRLFLKGNLDLYDSLHSCKLNNTICWNGINEVDSFKKSNIKVQIKHETLTRTDALLCSDGVAPSSLESLRSDLGAFNSKAQFSNELFRAPADAFILSVQPDIAMNLVRHKTEGYLFHPAYAFRWAKDELDWLKNNFESVKRLEPAESIANLKLVIDRIRQNSNGPILIFNTCSVIPGDSVYCYRGLTETLAIRAQQFNLELINLSYQTGISIVDVNRILASHGVLDMRLDTWHMSPPALRLIAEEVARILLELIPLSVGHD